MKTYLFPEVAGNDEIVEWVPADVARELFDVLRVIQIEGGLSVARHRQVGRALDKAKNK
jgi:hypothetical protein